MRASVVVPVRNGAEVIGRCLAALAAQDFPEGEMEVLVVDDGSTDGTAEAVRHYRGVTLLTQPPRGPAAARNRGIAAAQGEYVLFTDADCAPHPTWARALIEGVEAAGAAGGKGVYTTLQESLVARFVQIEYETKYARMRRRATIDFVDTYAAIYRRDVLAEVGGFDERLPSASVEDQELSFRVAARGHRLVFVPGASVEHLHAATLRGYARKKWNIGYWKVAILASHPTKVLDDAHTPQSLKAQVALTGLLGLSLPLAALGGAFAYAPFALAALLAVSWAPFLAYAWRRDRAVALAAPAILLVRAVALGLGLVGGLLARRGGAGRRAPQAG